MVEERVFYRSGVCVSGERVGSVDVSEVSASEKEEGARGENGRGMRDEEHESPAGALARNCWMGLG